MNEKIRADFPILNEKIHGKPLIYLDSAATAQKPQVVIDMISHLYSTCNANIHRGIHHLAEVTTEKYEAARETVREFINAESTREIIFTSGATASINLVAYSFGEQFIGEGDNVVITEMEHHSNIVPWQLVTQRKGAELRVVPFSDDGLIEPSKFEQFIDEKTRIVAITHTSNTLGTVLNIKEITSIAHEYEVPVLVDGCQAIVHQKVDVQELGADFYCFSGHKLYGPTGVGVLYGREYWLEQMPPFLGGGDMVKKVSFKKTTYAELPLKFEAGTSNFIDAIGLKSAIDYLNKIPTLEEVHKFIADLNQLFAKRLIEEIPNVEIYGLQQEKAPITSFNLGSAHAMDVAMIIDKLGVAIRSGTHCAEPVLEHFGVSSMCRASFGIYSNQEDVNVAISALKQASKMLG